LSLHDVLEGIVHLFSSLHVEGFVGKSVKVSADLNLTINGFFLLSEAFGTHKVECNVDGLALMTLKENKLITVCLVQFALDILQHHEERRPDSQEKTNGSEDICSLVLVPNKVGKSKCQVCQKENRPHIPKFGADSVPLYLIPNVFLV
jgi:hypothetical protein